MHYQIPQVKAHNVWGRGNGINKIAVRSTQKIDPTHFMQTLNNIQNPKIYFPTMESLSRKIKTIMELRPDISPTALKIAVFKDLVARFHQTENNLT